MGRDRIRCLEDVVVVQAQRRPCVVGGVAERRVFSGNRAREFVLEEILRSEDAVDALADGCARDPACTELIEGDLIACSCGTLATFDANPNQVEAIDERAARAYDVRLDGGVSIRA